jgi:hypothetical protein
MKKILMAALLGATAFSAGAANVGVSVNVGDPNFYGSIDIGNYPPPQLINPNPIIIQPAVGIEVAPLYLHVPLAHTRNWRRYCGIYNACGRPVYFVHDNWYRQVYAPRYRNEHEMRHDDRRDHEHRDGGEMRHEDHGDRGDHEHRDGGDMHRDHEHRDGEGR